MTRREALTQTLDAIHMPENVKNRIRAEHKRPVWKVVPVLRTTGTAFAALLVAAVFFMGIWEMYHFNILPIPSDSVTAPVASEKSKEEYAHEGEKLLESYFKALNDKDWETYLAALDPSEREVRRQYIDNPVKQEKNAGLHNIKSIRVTDFDLTNNYIVKEGLRRLHFKMTLEVEALIENNPDSYYNSGTIEVIMYLNATEDSMSILATGKEWRETPSPYGVLGKPPELTEEEWMQCADTVWDEFSAWKKYRDEIWDEVYGSIMEHTEDVDRRIFDNYILADYVMDGQKFVELYTGNQEYTVFRAELLGEVDVYRDFQQYGYDPALFLVEYYKADQPENHMMAVCVLMKNQDGVWAICSISDTERYEFSYCMGNSPLIVGTLMFAGASGDLWPIEISIKRRKFDEGALYAEYWYGLGYYYTLIKEYDFLAYRFDFATAYLDGDEYAELIIAVDLGGNVGAQNVNILSLKITDFDTDFVHLPVPGDGGGFTAIGKLLPGYRMELSVTETGYTETFNFATDHILSDDEFNTYYGPDGSLLQESDDIALYPVRSVYCNAERGTLEIAQEISCASPGMYVGLLVTELLYGEDGTYEIVRQRVEPWAWEQGKELVTN